MRLILYTAGLPETSFKTLGRGTQRLPGKEPPSKKRGKELGLPARSRAAPDRWLVACNSNNFVKRILVAYSFRCESTPGQTPLPQQEIFIVRMVIGDLNFRIGVKGILDGSLSRHHQV
jgi:hypothetical protein